MWCWEGWGVGRVGSVPFLFYLYVLCLKCENVGVSAHRSEHWLVGGEGLRRSGRKRQVIQVILKYNNLLLVIQVILKYRRNMTTSNTCITPYRILTPKARAFSGQMTFHMFCPLLPSLLSKSWVVTGIVLTICTTHQERRNPWIISQIFKHFSLDYDFKITQAFWNENNTFISEWTWASHKRSGSGNSSAGPKFKDYTHRVQFTGYYKAMFKHLLSGNTKATYECFFFLQACDEESM